MLRVAVVSDAVYPWNTGGKEQRLEELMSRVAERADVVVHTMRWWGRESVHRRRGITYRAICPKIALYAGPRRSVPQAVVFGVSTLQLLFEPFDVLDADAIPFLHLVPLGLIARLRRRPMVVTWHEFWGKSYWVSYLGPAGLLAAWIERACLRLPNKIIAASRSTADRILAETDGRVVATVIPNGISPEEMNGRADHPRREGPVRLLVVGRLLAHKNVDVAIVALDQLRRRGIDAALTVIGEGPEADRLRALATDRGLEVEFSAFLAERAALLDRMADADLLLFPSTREGFGMVALEAMALGTPVITTDHPDNHARNLVEPGESGEVCPLDPAELAAAVERCLPDLERRRTAARRAAQAYDWDALAGQTLELYRR